MDRTLKRTLVLCLALAGLWCALGIGTGYRFGYPTLGAELAQPTTCIKTIKVDLIIPMWKPDADAADCAVSTTPSGDAQPVAP